MAERENKSRQEKWITRQLEEKEAIFDGISDTRRELRANVFLERLKLRSAAGVCSEVVSRF